MSDSRSYDHRNQAGRMRPPSRSRQQRLTGEEDGDYPRPSRYDDSSYRGRQRRQQQQHADNQDHGEEDHDRSSRRRSHRDRSRSRSPPQINADHALPSAAAAAAADRAAKDDLEAARRQRMARLRAENEDEERRLQAFDRQQEHADTTKNSAKNPSSADAVRPEDLEGLDEMEQMKVLMGLDGFGSTKGQKVEDNHKTSARGAAAKNKARKYRQYMNRKARAFLGEFFIGWSRSKASKTFCCSLTLLSNFV